MLFFDNVKRVIWTLIIELHIREQLCQVFLEEVHPGVLVVQTMQVCLDKTPWTSLVKAEVRDWLI